MSPLPPVEPGRSADGAEGTDIEVGVRRAGAFLRRLSAADRFRDITLDQLADNAPTRVRGSVARVRGEVPAEVGAMTIGEILDRSA